MKKESRDRNWIVWITLGLSVIAIAISIIAICIACPHMPELGFDYQGVLVGILSLLVTALLGWNIYSAIQLDEIMNKKIEQAKEKAGVEIRKDFVCMQMKVIHGYISNQDWYMVMEGYYFLISDILTLKDKDKAKDIISLIDIILDKIPLVNKKEIESFQRLTNKIMKLSFLDESACDLYNKAIDKISTKSALIKK